jgi:hypothetical protein
MVTVQYVVLPGNLRSNRFSVSKMTHRSSKGPELIHMLVYVPMPHGSIFLEVAQIAFESGHFSGTKNPEPEYLQLGRHLAACATQITPESRRHGV